MPSVGLCIAGVWGFKQYPKNVHNRARRYVFGVHTFVLILAVCMMRLWKRILGLNTNKLVRQVCEWDGVVNISMG